MADKKIGAMTSSVAAGTDEVAINRGDSQDRKVTAQSIADLAIPSVGGEMITATSTFDIDLSPAFPSGSPVYTVPTGKVLKVNRVNVRHKTHSNDGVNAFIKWEADVIEIVAPYQLAATAVNGVDENITPPDMVFVAGDVVAMIITVVGTHTDNEAVASMEGVLYDA